MERRSLLRSTIPRVCAGAGQGGQSVMSIETCTLMQYISRDGCALPHEEQAYDSYWRIGHSLFYFNKLIQVFIFSLSLPPSLPPSLSLSLSLVHPLYEYISLNFLYFFCKAWL